MVCGVINTHIKTMVIRMDHCKTLCFCGSVNSLITNQNDVIWCSSSSRHFKVYNRTFISCSHESERIGWEVRLYVQVKSEQCTFITVSHEQQMSNLWQHSLEASQRKWSVVGSLNWDVRLQSMTVEWDSLLKWDNAINFWYGCDRNFVV